MVVFSCIAAKLGGGSVITFPVPHHSGGMHYIGIDAKLEMPFSTKINEVVPGEAGSQGPFECHMITSLLYMYANSSWIQLVPYEEELVKFFKENG